MSYRPRGRGQWFGRGKYHDSYGPESSGPVGRGYRGRGFTSNYQSPRFSPISSSPPPPVPQEFHDPISTLRQDVTQIPVSPEPVFTPQPTLDRYTQIFVDSLRQVWNLWKKSENVSRMLQEYFSSVENPYEVAFKVAVTCPDFYQGKPVSLPVTVIEELAVFMKSREENYTLCLNHSIKLDIFTIFNKQRNSLLTKLAFNTYKLKADNHLFSQLLQDLIRNHQYKEACQSATYLGLDQFEVEDFVIPLLFQDKLTIAEEFLKNSPKAQLETAAYLDKLLQGRVGDKVAEIVRQLKIPEVKQEKLQYKPICKLLTRFLKIYNIPPSCCSNLNQKKREGALQFVIRKRYKFNEIDGECWREMATEAVCNDPYLEEELVHQICLLGDIEEAAFFAEKFQLPFSKLPCNVVSFFKNGNKVDDSEFSPLKPPRSEQSKPKRLITLPSDHIVTMVDTDDQLMRCSEIVGKSDMVGLDAEWKPAFCGESGTLSLLQIATSHETFLVDVIALQNSTVWRVLSRVLFMDTDILKLGFGLATDLLKLKESIMLNDVKLDGLGYVDLNVVWKKLLREFNFTLPFKGEESDSVEGLSKLVSLCLGGSLDKSEQFSNWERRPLREAQKCYAALDAYCLLEVYRVLQAECSSQGVPFSDVCHGLMVASANTTKKSKKKKPPFKADVSDLSPSPNTTPVHVKEVKFVCDTMLQGLGRQLRTVGADTEILSNTQNHFVCSALSRQENRNILTKGVAFNQLRSQVPSGMCYHVQKTTSKDQLVEVLNYYNVIVTKEDIFSRCQHCNSGEFKKLSSQELRRAIDSVNKTCRPISNNQIGLHEEEMDDYDEFGGFSDGSDCSDERPGPVVASSSYTLSFPQMQAAPPDAPEEEEEFYGDYCRTNAGAHIKFESIPKEVFNKVPFFYICDSCGHCYWDGSHLERILGSRLKKVVTK